MLLLMTLKHPHTHSLPSSAHRCQIILYYLLQEPLTLTLPIQRKLRNENSLSSPTPPCTPSFEMSPVGSNATLSLMVDTQLPSGLESTPVKTNHLGLLQIANQSNGYIGRSSNPLATTTAGLPTAEEKIGKNT